MRVAIIPFFILIVLTMLQPIQADEHAESLEELRREIDLIKNREKEKDQEISNLRQALEGLQMLIANRSGVIPPAKLPEDASQPSLHTHLNLESAAGFSSERDEIISRLQGGGHDPKRRGFTLQQAELSFYGRANDIWSGRAHFIGSIDDEGETGFEIEEALIRGEFLNGAIDFEMGHFLTDFGSVNPTHPHSWKWIDQPVILSRFFGGDGMRAPGARFGWNLPVDWDSRISLSAQSSAGETMPSFRANDEVFEERPFEDRPFQDLETRSLKDLLYAARWENALDFESSRLEFGLSTAFGPNATGADGNTVIAGIDLGWIWYFDRQNSPWKHLTLEGEWLSRNYRADDFMDEDDAFHGATTLRDSGFYSQLSWGFHQNWLLGLRFEHALGRGGLMREDDPFRDDRTRWSPLLIWKVNEHTRIRFQYNHDEFEHGDADSADSFWFCLDIDLGDHKH